MTATLARSAVNINECGKVVSYTMLNHKCSMCNARADVGVERTNKGLPAKYCQSGTRLIHYCATHTPKWLKADVRSWCETIQTPPGA